MKHIACILLSLSLMAFGPAAGNSGPVDNMRQAEQKPSSDTAGMAEDPTHEMVEETACCTDLETCSEDSCDATKCSAGEVLAMPAVGLYAPLLQPQKPKMSLAKKKVSKKKKASTATKTLKP